MRKLIGVLCVGLLASAANAHFVFLVPDPAAGTVTLVFSDSLEPDAKLKAESFAPVAAAKLTARAADGTETPVTGTRDGNSLKLKLPAGTTAVYGTAVFGVFQKGTAPAQHITYFPKAVVGPLPADVKPVGAPVEIVPVAEGGKVRFRVLADGKPAAKVEVSVKAGEKAEANKLTTDEAGLTPAVEGSGRFAVYARVVADAAGEHNGKKYEKAARYATLVVDVK